MRNGAANNKEYWWYIMQITFVSLAQSYKCKHKKGVQKTCLIISDIICETNTKKVLDKMSVSRQDEIVSIQSLFRNIDPNLPDLNMVLRATK